MVADNNYIFQLHNYALNYHRRGFRKFTTQGNSKVSKQRSYHGSQRSGKLKEKTKEGLKIKNQESNKIFEIKYINMKKLEIKERQIPLPIFLGTIGGIVMMYLIVRGYGDAIEGMGK